MTSSTESLGISQIGQIAITVHDLPRAVAFYRDILGLSFLFEIPGAAFFDCGGVRLFLTTPEGNEFDHLASTLYYMVADIHQAYSQLKEQAVLFIDEPHLIARMPGYDLWMVFLHDSENNILALMAEVRP